MSWDITGNAGTNPSSNFLGTTDNQPLVIKTNATENMRIATNGSIGIGTNAPFARLQVAGASPSTSSTYYSLIGFSATDGEVGSLYYKNNGTTPVLGIESFNIGNTVKTPLVFQEYGGRVAIGTSTPSYSRLEVVGTTPSNNTSYDSIIGLDATDGVVGSLYHKSNGSTSIVGIESFNVGNTMKTPLVFQEYGGSVGIGTNAPIGRLHIVGYTPSSNAAYDPIVVFAATDGVIGTFYHGNNGSTSILGIESFNVGNTVKTPLVFQQYGGNVGIGTTTPTSKLSVQGDISVSGDVILSGADCAEEFDIAEIAEIEPGAVMVFDEEGVLHQCQQAYDKKVAGVISGAGAYRPGLILDRRQSQENRLPVALVGKVYCKVDAHYAPVEAGDLLTTSPTPGHAMKADDPLKAFGAVIGKALHPLLAGQSMIPILIALQ